MKTYEFIDRVLQHFGFKPTVDQKNALNVFAQFLADREQNTVMIMRGSAGTGKTSLASAMVNTLHSLGQKLVIMAPTGRAAKVFSQHCNLPAYTIHRTIYREKKFAGKEDCFNINFNKNHNTLFVIDEASMIGNSSFGDSNFGTGNLLDDIFSFVYNCGQNCHILFIGDNAQLPPIGENVSPALSPEVLANYNMRVYQCDLKEVLRQNQNSGILYNATIIRNLSFDIYSSTIKEGNNVKLTLPKIRFKNFSDIFIIPGNELIESISSSFSMVGEDDTLVITRSNKRANLYNNGIRNTILDREEALCTGDMLMVVKNKYLDQSEDATPYTNKQKQNTFFIANGDRCIVRRVRHIEDLYGFHFAEVDLIFPDLNDYEIETTIIMDTLSSDSPALTREQNEQLYEKVIEDYNDIPLKEDRIKALRQDKYFNALQVKFAYAVTCHKAQGGQWKHIYVDQGYMTDDMLTPEYYHWLYTAFTRATEKLFLINWPQTQTLTN